MRKKIVKARESAVWLARNTALSNKQIAQACGVDILELPYIKNTLEPFDCVAEGQFNLSDIQACEADTNRILIPTSKLDEFTPKTINLSRYVLKDLKYNEQIQNVVAWLMYNYSTITPKAISMLLRISLASAEQYVKQVTETQFQMKSPIEARLCSEKTLKSVIIAVNLQRYQKAYKTLSLEQIAGIANWLMDRYGHMSYVYDILKPLTPKKIEQAVRYYAHRTDPIQLKLLDELVLEKYSVPNVQ
jgi:hypothetical protein